MFGRIATLHWHAMPCASQRGHESRTPPGGAQGPSSPWIQARCPGRPVRSASRSDRSRQSAATRLSVGGVKDKDGNRLDGSRSYRLHVPANTPATAFWSLTLYGTGTRSMVQSPSNDAATRRTTTISRRTPTARSISTSAPKRHRAGRATGSRPYPGAASTRCSASTPPPRRCSTARGHCPISS